MTVTVDQGLMHSNGIAVKFAVLAAFVVGCRSAEQSLRKPTATSVTSPPTVLAAPATTALKGSRASSRAEQGKQEQVPASSTKVTSASDDAHLVASSPSSASLNAQLHEAEEQVHLKEKSIRVQEGLEKEKELEAAKAQKLASELRAKATKLRKEADIAADIAQEKGEEATKAEIGMNESESKVAKILMEEQEMQRVLNQTHNEELVLERSISALKAQHPKATALASKSVLVKSATATSEEAVQKLMEENSRLKHEKAELERQLSVRKVAKEKAKLKQKLKNRLALADRHSKLRQKSRSTVH